MKLDETASEDMTPRSRSDLVGEEPTVAGFRRRVPAWRISWRRFQTCYGRPRWRLLRPSPRPDFSPRAPSPFGRLSARRATGTATTGVSIRHGSTTRHSGCCGRFVRLPARSAKVRLPAATAESSLPTALARRSGRAGDGPGWRDLVFGLRAVQGSACRGRGGLDGSVAVVNGDGVFVHGDRRELTGVNHVLWLGTRSRWLTGRRAGRVTQ
jgi:hypothetical protein